MSKYNIGSIGCDMVVNEAATGNEHSAPRGGVFVVHGHNHAIRDEVVAVLTSEKLSVVVLSEEPHVGRSIIEKFEQESDVTFVVIVMTADDEGCLRNAPKMAFRARQNVIFEYGYFIAKVGRHNVVALVEPGIELPSDILGVGYIQMTSDGRWQGELLKELRAAASI